MEIHPYIGSTYFADQRNNYTERNHNKTILIIDGTVESGVFNVNEHSLTDIISKDKIYVSKYSSFSPLLLSRIEGIDVSRVISAEKATKIIVDETEYTEYKTDLFYGEFISSNEDLPVIRGLFNSQADYQVSFLVRVYNPLKKEYIKDVTSYSLAGPCRPCVILNVDFDEADLILAYPKKVVSTAKLEDYINDFLPELDKYTLDSCTGMLGSNDPNIVKMGINMLAAFNIKSYTIPISVAIRNNLNNLTAYKSLAAFKRLCNLCGLTFSDLKDVALLEFNMRIYRKSNNQEHKKLIKDNVAWAINNEILNSYSRYFDEIGLSFAINKEGES
jgi:hypothetical protein